MEKVGMDYSWGKVSSHDGHGHSSWTMPCYEKYPRTGQKRCRKFKLSNFRWFQSEAFKHANRQRNKSRKYVMGEKRRHFASKLYANFLYYLQPTSYTTYRPTVILLKG